ncbi:AARSD1 [Bugula neritina]|uniref:AARSD1 n=1 Tax=Bugula neritina TaxID=10212 RepID=A0A7J7KQP4_BUGNE|nr:AARSD1 [Bugula neritina]
MALRCQKDSYLQEFVSTVESCEVASEKINGSKLSGYHVILADTILFPEGGGQPDDRGSLNTIPVLKVFLKGDKGVHFTQVPIDAGTEVNIQLDWQRRFDHMQQHSAQHLISAIAETVFNFNTTSWSLGESVCKVEFNTPVITNEQINQLEELCNQYIREQRPMYPTYYELNDPAVDKIKTRGLPENIAGPLRVMTIEGIDVNLCCGTHVSNLAHLQVIKLLGTEKGKKGNTLLHFHAGKRVVSALEKSLNIERQINTLMRGSPTDYPDLIKKLQNSYKSASKNSSNLLKELVGYEAKELSSKLKESNSKYICHHRREGEIEYLLSLVQKLTCPEHIIKFITVGDDRGAGNFILCGVETDVKELAPKVLELIDGKGAVKGGRLMGKASKLSQKHKVEHAIEKYLESKDATNS